MKAIQIFTVCIALIGLAGCADTTQLVKLSGDPSSKLDINGSVYISTPKDGIYGSTTYSGSGANTAIILQSAFAKRIRNIEVGRTYEKFEDALDSARKNKSKYLVYPTILHWEDRATEWSGIPDKVEVKVEIINTSSGKTVSSSVVKGKSKWLTFGGDHPQDMLAGPIENYVASLY